MAIKTLEALALATLSESALISRIAAIWCRAFNNRFPYSKVEVVQWVKREFGPIIDTKRREPIAIKLIDEVKRQVRIRKRRIDRGPQDPLMFPAGSAPRLGALLDSRLGPARGWFSKHRLLVTNDCAYADGAVYSGLVAGLIPVEMKLRRFENPSLLVYRRGWSAPMSYWVPGHILTVADAFIWVIPPAAAEFLRLEGSRVEHDGEAQAVRLITQFGTKSLPWRSL